MDYEALLEAAKVQAREMGYDPDDDQVLSDLMEGMSMIEALGL